jgi:uncharacterized membrane protein
MQFIERVIHAITELHPLHPMFVHFPIGLTGAAFLFILLAWLMKNNLFEKTASLNMALAAISTFFAGASGIYDNNLNYDGDAPFAPIKLVLGLTLFVLTTGLVIFRWKKPDIFDRARGPYILVFGLSFGIALVLAFLGGAILYGF